MRIEQLKYLTEVAKTRSINVAADNLFVSQPTISESIKKLEQELDVTLLNRSHSGISITPIGEVVVEMSHKIIQQTTAMNATILQYKQESQLALFHGPLKIASVGSISNSILPETLAQFSEIHPQISHVVMEQSIAKTVSGLFNDEIDLGIISFFEHYLPFEHLDTLAFTFLSNQQAYAIVRADCSLRAKHSVGIKELLNFPLAFWGHDIDDGYIIPAIFGNHEPNTQLITNSAPVFRQQILSRNFIGIVLGPSLNDPPLMEKQMYSIPIKTKSQAQFGVIYKKNQINKKVIMAFLDLLKTHF